MVWPFGTGSGKSSSPDEKSPEPIKKAVNWVEDIGRPDEPLAAAKEWAPMVIFSLFSLGALQLYSNYLRRIPGAAFVKPSFFRSRSVFGRVTSVGDGDNFHLFHTPGGKAVGWGWLRKVPQTRKELKDRTVCLHIYTVASKLTASDRSLCESPESMPQKELILAVPRNRTPPKPCNG
jgi:hypothetical protein